MIFYLYHVHIYLQCMQNVKMYLQMIDKEFDEIIENLEMRKLRN